MHTLTLAACFLALSSAFLMYGLTYDTRLIEARVGVSERQADRLRSDISILRAERAHLARPARIEPMARALGMAPARADQIAGHLGGRLADADAAR